MERTTKSKVRYVYFFLTIVLLAAHTTAKAFEIIRIEADVVGDIKNPGRVVDNAGKQILQPTGEFVGNVVDVAVKPTRDVLRETSTFIRNVDDEFDRGLKNGTVQEVAVLAAAYAIAGPAAFELTGGNLIAGTAITHLGLSKLLNIDTNISSVNEKIVLDGVKHANKVIEPFINAVETHLCTSLGVAKSSCNITFLLQSNRINDEWLIGLGSDYAEYYRYYKATYDRMRHVKQNAATYAADMINTNISAIKKYSHTSSNQSLPPMQSKYTYVTLRDEDPVLTGLIYANTYSGIAMRELHDMVHGNMLDDVGVINALDSFNSWSEVYATSQFVLKTNIAKLDQISNPNIQDTIKRWSIIKDGDIYINKNLIDDDLTLRQSVTYNMLERAEPSRGPANFKLLATAFTVATLSTSSYVANYYNAWKMEENIHYYKEMIWGMNTTDLAKYQPILKDLETLSNQNALMILQQGATMFPDVIKMYGELLRGKLPLGRAVKLLDTINGKEYKAQLEKLREITKQLDRNASSG